MKRFGFKVVKKKIRRTLEWFKLQKECAFDAHRYFRAASWAGPGGKHELAHIHSELIKHYHVVEKGLAMADFRPRSGVPVLRRLIELLAIWKDAGGKLDDYHYLGACNVVVSYHQKHKALKVDVSDVIPFDFFGIVIEKGEEGPQMGGVKDPLSVARAVLSSFDEIALSRHSVRQFDESRLPARKLINGAVEVALSSPSVCNRQTWRVHLYEGDAAQEVLSLQNGNRGFGHAIPTVAIVTSDMRYFSGGVERYQSWIEGGLFSMSFLLSLHARGLSSIPLNWSCLNRADRKLRGQAGIPKHERIIMMIGVGYARKGHVVALSPRSAVENFVNWH